MSKPINIENIQPDPQCVGCLPDWGTQPSSDEYLKLTNSLFAIEKFLQSGHIDQLEAGIDALFSVLTYLNSNPVAVRLGLTRPLASIGIALRDVSRGAKPAIIFDRRPKGSAGAPTHTSRAALRAQVILLFKVLANAGTVPVDASKWLGAELKQAGVLDKGKPIAPGEIVRWSRELGGKSLSGSDRVYRRLKAGQDRRGWPEDPRQARVRVRKLVRALKAAGF